MVCTQRVRSKKWSRGHTVSNAEMTTFTSVSVLFPLFKLGLPCLISCIKLLPAVKWSTSQSLSCFRCIILSTSPPSLSSESDGNYKGAVAFTESCFFSTWKAWCVIYFNHIRIYFFWRKFWPKWQQNYYRHMENKEGGVESIKQRFIVKKCTCVCNYSSSDTTTRAASAIVGGTFDLCFVTWLWTKAPPPAPIMWKWTRPES